MNSLTVLLAFLVFTLFGYLSLVRILYKFQFGKSYPSLAEWWSAVGTNEFARRLPQSILFVSLPAVSLLLYWGWGPALLWLVIGHLLIDTIVSFLISSPKIATPPSELFLQYSGGRGAIRALVSQLSLMVLTSIVVVILANMIDQQTGLLFALIGVLISIHMLRSASGALDAVIKLLASAGLLLVGLTLAHQMGVSIFGNWAPLPEQIPWLKFDNRTLLAAFLLVAAVQLTASTSLHKGILNVVAATVIGLLLILLGAIVWQQPLLDAPLLSTNQRDVSLPAFASLFLLLSATTVTVLSQLLSGTAGSMQPEGAGFLQRQSLNLFLLIFSLVVCLWLASAGGIGAWNTHYTDWPGGATLQKHFSLVLRTSAFASHSQASAASVPFTLLVIAFCLFGVAVLLTLLKLMKFKSADAAAAEREESTLLTAALSKINIHFGLVFIACCWLLSNGIPAYLWVLTMALCWLMVCDVLLTNVVELQGSDLSSLFFRGFVLVFFAVGAIQIFWVGLTHVMDGQVTYALGHVVVLGLAIVLLLGNLVHCAKGLQKRPDRTLFKAD